MVKYMCTTNVVHMKPEVQHMETRAAAARLPRRLLSPNNILPQPAYHCAFTAAEKILVRVDKNDYFLTFI